MFYQSRAGAVFVLYFKLRPGQEFFIFMTFQKKQFIFAGTLMLIVFGGAVISASYGKRGAGDVVSALSENAQEALVVEQASLSPPSEFPPAPEHTLSVQEEPRAAIRATLRAGDVVLHLAVQEGTTLYDAMRDAQSAGKLSFSGREYTGLGFFVTDIGTLHEDEGKYAVYYVNGEQASVGVSSYVVREGDVIEWKLE